jgi:hypothetical protein
MVLTRAYVNTPQYKAERDLALSRLYAHGEDRKQKGGVEPRLTCF